MLPPSHIQIPQPPAAMQLVLDHVFADLDAVRETVTGWDLDFVQLEPGPFGGRIRQWTAGPVFLTRALFEKRLAQHGASPGGGLTIAVPRSEAFDVCWRGQHVTGDHLMVFPDDGELEAVSAPGFDVFTITLTPTCWARLLADAAELAEPAIRRCGRASRCSREAVRRLRRVLMHSEAGGALAPDVIPLLVLETLQTSNDGEPVAQTRSDRRRALRAAVQYMHSRLHRPIRLTDLSRATGVSERTLQYAFRAEYGLSPTAYLHLRRLHGVRAALLRSDDSRPGAIARIARAHGLSHAGRFSADYRTHFGELPSRTTKRGVGR